MALMVLIVDPANGFMVNWKGFHGYLGHWCDSLFIAVWMALGYLLNSAYGYSMLMHPLTIQFVSDVRMLLVTISKD